MTGRLLEFVAAESALHASNRRSYLACLLPKNFSLRGDFCLLMDSKTSGTRGRGCGSET